MALQLKTRLFGLFLFLFFAGAIIYDWHLLINYGYFYPKLGGVAPLGVLGSLVVMIHPASAGRPNPADRTFKVWVIIVTVIGLILGGINFYLMNTYQP
ncbi:MAG TPA: hypothetical protein VK619_14650 [Pyrinomonadaceae bacterium]|nr:hypothetical protein [Pyrinomonadaceae bacterium]